MSTASAQGSDRRIHPRTTLNARVRVAHEMIGESLFYTRDISDGGIYVVVDGDSFAPMGSVVEVQVQGLPIPAPILKMQVVRRGVDGYGLQFV